jgi:hypothetical protein
LLKIDKLEGSLKSWGLQAYSTYCQTAYLARNSSRSWGAKKEQQDQHIAMQL